jgi:hypothetical protein
MAPATSAARSVPLNESGATSTGRSGKDIAASWQSERLRNDQPRIAATAQRSAMRGAARRLSHR